MTKAKKRKQREARRRADPSSRGTAAGRRPSRKQFLDPNAPGSVDRFEDEAGYELVGPLTARQRAAAERLAAMAVAAGLHPAGLAASYALRVDGRPALPELTESEEAARRELAALRRHLVGDWPVLDAIAIQHPHALREAALRHRAGARTAAADLARQRFAAFTDRARQALDHLADALGC